MAIMISFSTLYRNQLFVLIYVILINVYYILFYFDESYLLMILSYDKIV